jgi:branched-chain amino acid transport system ATP-binding protein
LAAPELVLAIAGLAASYGKVAALRCASLSIGAGEAVALLGANGSGKTTLLRTICGFLPPAGGEVKLDGVKITGLPPHKIFALGIVQVSQGRDLFGTLSVIDNLRLGAARRRRPGPELAAVLEYFPQLRQRQRQLVYTLSGGEQQMVALARALMSAPRILLLDEPSGGLAPRLVEEIGRIVNALKEKGATLLLVEQNLKLAAMVADRFYILRDGETVAEGDAAALKADQKTFAHAYYL